MQKKCAFEPITPRVKVSLTLTIVPTTLTSTRYLWHPEFSRYETIIPYTHDGLVLRFHDNGADLQSREVEVPC